MNNSLDKLKVWAKLYSVLSVLLLPFLIIMQFFSIFLFDDPSYNMLPYFLAFGILLIPIVLIVCNIMLWVYIKKERIRAGYISMTVPVVYTFVFFLIWFVIGIIFG